jgi:hypothetical protein
MKPTTPLTPESLHAFKRLSPTYDGVHLPEELRQFFAAFHSGGSGHYEPGGWAWDFGSGFFQCEILVYDLDDLAANRGDVAGYLAIRPISETEPYQIYCGLYDDKKFAAEAEVVSAKIFRSMAEAKAFLDSVLAFPTPKIPAPV